jgi:hypothetical protein
MRAMRKAIETLFFVLLLVSLDRRRLVPGRRRRERTGVAVLA